MSISDIIPWPREYHVFVHRGIVCEVWKVAQEAHFNTCPWRFALTDQFGIRRRFAGVPNYGSSRRESTSRAVARARWLSEGRWSDHYTTSGALPKIATSTEQNDA